MKDASGTPATDGDVVEEWRDYSGNANKATQGNAVNMPTYKTGALNGRPVLRFDGSSHWMAVNFPSNGLPETNYTQFVVFNSGDADGCALAVAQPPTYSGGSHDRQFGMNNSKLSSRIWDNQTISSGSNFNDNATHIGMLQVEKGAGQEIYADGASVVSGTKDESDFDWEEGLLIGGHQEWGHLDGDIGEVILYDKVLNQAERITVENYLSSKYDVPIPNDHFAFDGNYGHDVVGVGQSGGTVQNPSMSDSILEIAALPGGLSDGNFLFWGHDNGGVDTWKTNDVPHNDVQRISRVWKMDETNNMGDFRFLVDTSKFSPRPAGFTKFVLLIDDDGDFTSGTNIHELNQLPSPNDNEFIKTLDPDGKYVSIGVLRPKVEFTSTASDDFEPVTSPSFQVHINYIPFNSVDVDYSTSDAGATGGDHPFASPDDYKKKVDSTVTIAAGDTTETFSVDIHNDTDVESDESFDLTLGNPSIGSIGPNATHTYTIHDDDNNRKIYFSNASSNGDESVSPVSVTIELTPSEVDPANDTKVDYAVTGGDATGGGTDYTLSSGTATIPANDQQTTISFTVNDDNLFESDETLVISLSNPVNGNLALPSNNPVEHTYTIQDNDAQPEIEFGVTSSSNSEDHSPVAVSVLLSEKAGTDITVDYIDDGSGTATSGGVDYTLNNGTVTVPAGDTSAPVNFSVNDDSQLEVAETVGITIQNPSGASLGANTSHTYTIIDNDQFGHRGPGGVGNKSSTNNLRLWLRADSGAYSDGGTTLAGDGSTVQEWHDITGNDMDAVQSNGGKQPTYKASGINGMPAMDFDGSSNWMKIEGDVPEANYSQFAVFQSSDANGAISTVTDKPIQYNASSHDRQFGFNGGGNFGHRLYDNEVISSSASYNDGNVHSALIHVSGSGQKLFLDGQQDGSGTKTSSDFNLQEGLVLGGHSAWDYFDGRVSEFFLYQTDLNSAQRIIVHNYISSAYGVSIPAGDDKFTYDGTFGDHVGGIGRENASNFHQDAQPGAVLRMNSPLNLGNGDYLLWGHDEGDIGSWTNTETPDNNTKRVAREWRVDETGEVGDLSVLADTSNLPAKPAGFSKYVVLVDADGDFSSGAEVHQMPPSGSGSYVRKGGLNLSEGEYITIGVLRPSIEFRKTASDDFEPNTSPSFAVHINYFPQNPVTVDYTTSDVSANGGNTPFGANEDYESVSGGTITIPAGDTATTFTANIHNDTKTESDESFDITLNNPSLGTIGTNKVHTYTIHDDDNDRKIYFSSAASNGDESVSPVSVTVELTPSEVDPSNDTKVDYSVTGGDATGGGTDYTLASGTAIISSGDQSTTFSFTVNDDNLYESDETIEISLSNPVNGNLAQPSNNPVVHTYTINDNDPQPEIEFGVPSSSDAESHSPVSVGVLLSTPAGTDVTVDYEDNGTGTATPGGTDYTLNNGTVTIPAGDTTGQITFGVNDDNLEESTETVGIDILNPSGANLGSVTSHTYNIIDNDVFGYLGPGGVGDSKTSNNLLIWLQADSGAYNDAGTTLAADGDKVRQWHERTGSGLKATQGVGGDRPTYRSSAINGRPAIEFDGNKSWMGIDGDVPEASYTQFAVFESADVQGVISAAVDDNGNNVNAGSHDRQFGFNGGGNFGSRIWDQETITSNGTYNDGDGTPHTALLDVSSAGQKLYFDHMLDKSGSVDSISSEFNWQNGLLLGSHEGTWGYFSGEIAEFAIYQTNLNTTQRKIVNNYTHTTYGTSLAGADDKYSYDGTYPEQLAGIGKESNTDFHIDAQGGFVRINAALDLDNGEYFLWGHDDASAGSWSKNEVPLDSIQRIDREWRVDETGGDVGKMDLLVDTTALPAKPGQYEVYILMVDTDGDADFTTGSPKIYPFTDQVDEYLTADTVSMAAGDHFTIGMARNRSLQTGNWDKKGIWLTKKVPGTNEHAIISPGDVVDLSSNTKVGSIFIDADGGNSGQLSLNSYVLDITKGTIDSTGNGSINGGTGTVDYAANGAQMINPFDYHDLSVSGNGTKTLAGNITLTNDLFIGSNAVLDADNSQNYNITISGDWSGDGIFKEQQSTVTFTGTAAQSINKTNGEGFYDLAISKSDNGVELKNANDTIFNSLKLNNGYYRLNGNLLYIDTPATGAIEYSDGYVVSEEKPNHSSRIRWNMSDSTGKYVFPFGTTAGDTIPFHFDLSSGGAGKVTVSTYPTAGDNTPYPVVDTDTVEHVNHSASGNDGSDSTINRFWQIWKSGSGGTADMVFTYADGADVPTAGESLNFRAQRWNNANEGWEPPVNGSHDASNNRVKANGVSNFSPWVLSAELEPLPVELLAFDAEAREKEDIVQATWKTATETDNDFFTVERSKEGDQFEPIGRVEGAGNSSSPQRYTFTDPDPYSGVSYYRLRQTDFNGITETFGPVAVEFDGDKNEPSVAVYPNPTDDKKDVNVSLSGFKGREVLVVLRDVLGKKYHSKVVITETSGPTLTAVDIKNKLPAGVYMVTASSENEIYREKLVIE